MQKITMHKKIALLLAASIILSGFSACGTKEVQATMPEAKPLEESTEGLKLMLDEPLLEYEIPVTTPSISVNLDGYELADSKQAILVSDNLPSSFAVINAESEEVVYESAIKRIDADYGDDKEAGIADFSEVTKEGTYYLYAELLGVSKTFPITKNKYKDNLKKNIQALSNLRFSNSKWNIPNLLPLENETTIKIDVAGGWLFGENGERDAVKGAIAAMDLMLAFEYNQSSFRDDTGINESGNKIPDILDEITYEMQWLMKMQNPATGGVYTSIYLPENETSMEALLVGGETTRATAYFCAAMAKYSMVCKPYDASMSKQCFDAAQRAYKCLEANKDIVSSDQKFRAATEMYKATGYGVYNKVILDFLKTNADKEYEGRTVLDGAITYLATPRATDADYCSKLMANYMSRTEDKSYSAQKSRYLVERDIYDTSDLLRNADELVVVDYIISSVEYLKLEKNYYHYICGRNEKSEDLSDFGTSPDLYAQFIILLGRLARE